MTFLLDSSEIFSESIRYCPIWLTKEKIVSRNQDLVADIFRSTKSYIRNSFSGYLKPGNIGFAEFIRSISPVDQQLGMFRL